MLNFKKYIKDLVKEIGIDEKSIEVAKPPKENMGDFAIPCFTINIDGLKNPHEKANFISSKLNVNKNMISKVEVVGPYINFTINREKLAEETIKCIFEENEKYGSLKDGEGKNLLLEHTSINPNASPHIGRSRNSIIGNFLVNLYKFDGYNVETHYFINDIGKQIAMLLVGIEKKDIMDTVTFEDMLKLYVEINDLSKEDKNVEKRVFELLNKLENGDEKVRNKFKHITDICVEGQKKIFNKMNIKWDVFTHESDFVFGSVTKDIIEKLNDSGKLKEDENGRLYVDLSDYDIPTKSPVLVITREDKTSLYPLRDIAYTIYKMNANKDNNFIVLGEDQEVYMQQIAAVLDILGYNSPKLVSYSFVLLNGDKMATREGKVVLLEDFIKEAKRKIKEGFEERGQKVDDEKISSMAASCIKYNMLNVNRKRNVNFNLDEATNFQGNSAMYILYNYARICSILEKDGNSDKYPELLKFKENLEYSLISTLYDFPDVINTATKNQESIGITSYLHELSQKFSKYYESIPILSESDYAVRQSRIALLNCTKTVLENGMNVLGIEPFKKL